MTFERSVRKELRELYGDVFESQWLSFSDAGGFGYAQPDCFIVRETEILLFEAKLTQSDSGELQCTQLYVPLLEKIFQKPCVACQVFKNIRYKTGRMIEDAKQLEGKRGYWLWHRPVRQ